MRGLFGALAGAERKSVQFDQDWTNFFGLVQSKTGVLVTQQRALEISTVLACVRVLANGVAQVPFRVYREKPDGSKSIAVEHPAHRILSRRPNDWQTSFDFRQTLMAHTVLAGDGVAYINRVGGKPKELIPFVPGSWSVTQEPDYGLVYDVYDGRELLGRYPGRDILHVRNLSWNGYRGLEPIALLREALGLAVATEESQARFHANGTRPGGLLTVDQSLSDEARAKIRKALAERGEGLANAFKTLVLDKGADFKPFGMSGVDAQHLETRKHQIEEICRGMGVFPQMVGHTDKTATFASAEAFFQAHVTHSVEPHAVNFQQACDRALLDDDPALFSKLDLRHLVPTDFKTRMEGYGRALGSGGSPAWLTQDEVRAEDGRDPLGGDAAVLPKPTNVGGGAPAPKPA